MAEENIKLKNLANAQIEVETSKFESPVSEEHISRTIKLPLSYGKDRIIALVRDPWWIFVYWEITPQREKAVSSSIQANKEEFDRSILRIYDITGIDNFNGKNAHRYFDITLKDLAKNWYIDVASPGCRWCVEIGLLSKQGNFYSLYRSNIVNTPPFGISEVLDESWMLSPEEYSWLFGVSAGFDPGKSSLEMKELFKKYLKEWISSGGVFSLGSHILQQKK
ncbi:MAG: DUF4912 domain-containing protein [Candidatus Omnitrophica bacterium]|nr:DUF4912 domain-containing protein [Candidatus Omnitrophota bacterium]